MPTNWVRRLGRMSVLATTLTLSLLATVVAMPAALAAPRSPADRATQATAIQCGKGWQIVPSPGLGTTAPAVNGVAAVSANDVWVVGGYHPSSSSNERTLIEHWNGSSVRVAPSPNLGPDDQWLNGVASVPGSRTVWAVGEAFTHQFADISTLIERWNGTAWQIVPSPNPGSPFNELFAVTAVSENDVWAVGTYSAASLTQTLIEHWNGKGWQVVPSPNANGYDDFLLGVAAISTNDVWAVGAFYLTNVSGDVTNALIEHWNGTRWQLVSNPVGYNFRLNGVTALSATNAWAVGDPNLIEHWNGGGWQVVAAPTIEAGDTFMGAAALSASNVWAVGLYSSARGGIFTLAEQWNGARWQAAFTPNLAANDVLNAVARVPETSTLWAAGTTTGSAGYPHPLLEARC